MDFRVEDLFTQVKFDDQYIDASLKVRVDTFGSGGLRVDLFNTEINEVHATDFSEVTGQASTEFSLHLYEPIKWTAESPNLYHLIVVLEGDNYQRTYVTQRVGFRQVEMKDGLIKVNGQRIVLKGANRHEHHPKFGRAVPYEFMKQDLLLMKRHNINAIRTSHQPSDTRLYDLADELGVRFHDYFHSGALLTNVVLHYG